MAQGQLIWEHRKTVMLAILTLPIMLCSACSRTPSCTSEDVKGLVLDISKGELKNRLTARHFSVLLSKLANNPSLSDEARLTLMGMTMNPQLDELKYDEAAKLKGEFPGMDDMLATVDKEVASTKVDLTDIRLGAKYSDQKKCECAGNLSLSNGKTLSITYEAQFTEDGKLHVGVSGLNGL